jgi:zinc protease
MTTFTRTLALFITAAAMTTMSASQGTLDRTTRPAPLPTPKVQLPHMQKARLSNGLTIRLVEHHELPTIAFNLVLNAGADHDPADKPGIASMTADVLDEGTATRDALQIADELDFIGASLGTRSDLEGAFLTLNTITKHLNKALAVYADVIVRPTFPAKDFERLRKQRQTALMQQKDRPPAIASLAFSHIIYGEGHPYGRDAAGTEKSLAAMTRDDLVNFYTTYYRPNNATLIIVGDITLGEITERLERLFAEWKPGSIPAMAVARVPSKIERKLYLIDKPGAAQSEIRIGFPAVARNTPDFFAINLMNRDLGGQFSSRLNLNLREKHGFTYGARSSFSFNKQPGPFVASAGVVTAKTDSSLQEFKYEIDKMGAEGMTADQLTFVKKGFLGGFAMTFETPAQIAGALQNIVMYNLPDDYYATYLQNIDKVTLDDINKAAKKYLNTAHMAFVVVGDLKTIREGSEKLGLGETVLCDVEGNPLPKK